MVSMQQPVGGPFPELRGLDYAGLEAAFRDAPPDGPQFGLAYWVEVAALLATSRRGRRFLRKAARDADPERSAAALFGLAGPGGRRSRRLRRLLESKADSGHPVVAAEAIEGLASIGAHQRDATVAAWLARDSGRERSAALRYAAEHGRTPLAELLRPALQDPDSQVRFHAANLADDHDAFLAEDVEPLLRDPDADVRWIAAHMLERARK